MRLLHKWMASFVKQNNRISIPENINKPLDKYRGCLLGGAVGDALGYPVEFMQDYQIQKKYGERGITEYSLVNGIAQISDDTQMTLFTADGLLSTALHLHGDIEVSYFSYAYNDWLWTQTGDTSKVPLRNRTWLINIPEMRHSRAPGRTCIDAISSGQRGSINNPINDSKGCGGIMRVAPVGLYLHKEFMPMDEIDITGAETAALTHGHELGYIPAAMLVHIISLLAHRENISLLETVTDARRAVILLFRHAKHLGQFINLIDKAIWLASKHEIKEKEAIQTLGEGWVAEETLAIAIYCSLRHEHNFEKAIIASVNHSGDSDSTGSVTGNIMGAYLGVGAIPKKYLTNLELRDIIIEIADDLYKCRDMLKNYDFESEAWDVWASKYIYRTYPKIICYSKYRIFGPQI